jgi:hypothetical protein
MSANGQCRTINMSETRRRMVALCAAHLGVTSSEQVIQAAISALMVELAARDKGFAFALARTAGVTWDDIERMTYGEVFDQIGIK